MALVPGQRLGPYEVLGPLGAGGMGEVYRARDTKLGREVALKVLPSAFARDRQRLERFEREAHLLAGLNHPNIASVFGLVESEDGPVIVLELIPGESLADRLVRGRLGVGEAVALAAQVAAALEAAHERGTIHRDLKPSNILVTPAGLVKVLDFGLGKQLTTHEPGPAEDPTLTADGTAAGAILGTPAYMSPEQARGRPVDKRGDLWALGCVLFEALSGRPAFPGETTSDTLAAVLERDPDWGALPRSTPPGVRHLMHRCLEKDPARRLRDAGDARLELEEAQRQAGGRRAVRAWPAVALGLAALATALLWRARPRVEGTVQSRLSQVTFAEGIEEFPAFSPSGGALAYCVESGKVRKIVVKDLPAGPEAPLTSGPNDDIQPAWSADGRAVVFVRSAQAGARLEPADVFGLYDGGGLWAVDVGSRQERFLVAGAYNPSFSPDGTRIAVDASWAGPRRIWLVDPQGHNPQQITTDTSEAVTHLRPRWSPDGSHIVFQNIERTKFDIRVVDVGTRRTAWVNNDLFVDLDPVWSPSGRYICFSSLRSGGLNVWRIPVSGSGAPAGAPQQLTAGAGQDIQLAIAPDGKRLAFAILKQNADIWRLPVSAETGSALGAAEQVISTTREDSRGAWSPDGETIAFNSDRAGQMNIWTHSLKSGTERQLTRGPGGDFQPAWSPDGRTIAFFSSRSGAANIWTVDVEGAGLRQLTRGTSIDVNPFFSPDGTQIAFQSDEGGRLEVWIMGSDGSDRRPLTRTGVTGHFMRWSRDGHWLFFKCLCDGHPRIHRVRPQGGESEPVGEVTGGSHISLSRDESRIMDVLDHKVLWVSPLKGGRPERVFSFDDPQVRIDYPVWSPDGRFVLFDRFRPQGGDIWIMEGLD